MINQYALPPRFPRGTRHYNLGRELVKKDILSGFLRIAISKMSSFLTPYNPIEESGGRLSFKPAKVDELVSAIKKMKLSQKERQQMGEKGANYAFKHNSFDKLSAKLEKVLLATQLRG